MSSPAQFLYADFAHEHASTRRLLEGYPTRKGEWRPHDKSRPLAALATHVADIVNRGTNVLADDGMDIIGRKPLPPLDSPEDLLAHFDAAVAKFDGLLAAASMEDLDKPWTLKRGDAVMFAMPRRLLLRTFMMSHLVHHRAQLGVYYRLLGVPVPGMYGPSADD